MKGPSMATTTVLEVQTLADLLVSLGGIPPERVRVRPPLGAATEADVIAVRSREKRLCELVDGVLVEKAMGFRESALAGVILALLREFVIPRNLGIVLGPDGMLRLQPGLVRIPDVAYLSWDRFPDGRYPSIPLPDVAPDLAVEVLSDSNTRAEMDRKYREYFASGVRVVWEVEPELRTVAVYGEPEDFTVSHEDDVLDGGTVLPGFALAVRDIFAELDRERTQ
jgi:Uma2 family endonuclease